MSRTKNILVIIAVTLLTAKVFDASFGILYEPTPVELSGSTRHLILREHGPNQSALLTPPDRYMLATDSLEQRPYKVTVDENGFISNGNARINNPEYTVIFFGGSTTESVFVSEENRFPSLIEMYLRNNLSEKIKVYNAGVSGSHSMHSLLQLLGKGLPLKPQVAVLMNNINDLAVLSRAGSYWSALQSSRSIIVDTNQKDRGRIFYVLQNIKNFFVPNLYRYIVPRLRARYGDLFLPGGAIDEFADYRQNFSSMVFSEILVEYERSLLSFVRLCRVWGIEPVLMTQFNRIDASDSIFENFSRKLPEVPAARLEEMYTIFNDVVRNVAGAERVVLIDLDRLVPHTSEFIYDVIHVNDTGSRLVAEIVSPILLDVLRSVSENSD